MKRFYKVVILGWLSSLNAAENFSVRSTSAFKAIRPGAVFSQRLGDEEHKHFAIGYGKRTPIRCVCDPIRHAARLSVVKIVDDDDELENIRLSFDSDSPAINRLLDWLIADVVNRWLYSPADP
jgi:hypothetical protein